jgi:hypothetical protein
MEIISDERSGRSSITQSSRLLLTAQSGATARRRRKSEPREGRQDRLPGSGRGGQASRARFPPAALRRRPAVQDLKRQSVVNPRLPQSAISPNG